MSSTSHEILDASRRILATRGPQAPAELVPLLRAEGLPLPEEGAAEHVEEILLADDDLFATLDGRYGDPRSALDGIVLTHLVAGHEGDAGRLELEPDFSLLLVLGDEELPLVGGGALRIRHENSPFGAFWSLEGPPGWLPDHEGDELLALRLSGGEVALSVVHIDDEAVEGRDEAAVTAILDAHEQIAAALGFSDPHVVLLTVLVDHPELFRSPLSPLYELYELAGLVQHEDRLLSWEQYQGLEQDDELSEDAEAVEGIDLLLGAVSHVVDEGMEGLDGEDLATIGEVMSLPAVAAVTVLGVSVPDPDGEPGTELEHAQLAREALGQLARAVAAQSRREAGPHLVLARLAETGGEVERAEQHVRDALNADRDHPDALRLAADFAEARGDAPRALDYRRRMGLPPGDRRVARLEYYAGPGPTTGRRNEPCPCGSGRKHKICCGPRNGHPLHDRAGWVLDKAVEMVVLPEHDAVLTPIVAALAGREAPDQETTSMAALWDRLVQDLALFEEDLWETFVEQRGVLLPADELELARSWADSRLGLFEVSSTAQHGWLELIDLRDGEPVEVPATPVLAPLAEGTVVLGRLLPDGRSQQLMGAVEVIPPPLVTELTSLLQAEVDVVTLAGWVHDRLDRVPLVRAPLQSQAVPPDDEEHRRRFAVLPRSGHWEGLDLSLLDPADADDRRFLLEAEHPELADDLMAELEDAFQPVDVETSATAHLAFHEVVAAQLWDDDPPEVWQTARRLVGIGYDRHEILHMLAWAMTGPVFEAMTGGEEIDPAAHREALRSLPDAWESLREHGG
ncbi:SEC-C metal-binding domain-containing protein [soil metagenome]